MLCEARASICRSTLSASYPDMMRAFNAKRARDSERVRDSWASSPWASLAQSPWASTTASGRFNESSAKSSSSLQFELSEGSGKSLDAFSPPRAQASPTHRTFKPPGKHARRGNHEPSSAAAESLVGRVPKTKEKEETPRDEVAKLGPGQ
jgi:hypothetical protein